MSLLSAHLSVYQCFCILFTEWGLILFLDFFYNMFFWYWSAWLNLYGKIRIRSTNLVEDIMWAAFLNIWVSSAENFRSKFQVLSIIIRGFDIKWVVESKTKQTTVKKPQKNNNKTKQVQAWRLEFLCKSVLINEVKLGIFLFFASKNSSTLFIASFRSSFFCFGYDVTFRYFKHLHGCILTYI